MTLPEIGASRDSWGAKWNDNLTTIDQLLYMAMPIGAVIDFCGPTPPDGWLVADGRLISRLTYSALFAVLGTNFGAGDGSTTFGLPNLCGRSGVGPGTVIDQVGTSTTFTFTQTLGNVGAQITQSVLPALTLTSDTAPTHAHGGATAPGANHSHTMDVQGWHSHGVYDPGHTHLYADAASWGSGSQSPGGAGYATTDQTRQTQSSGANGTSIAIISDGNHAHNISASGNLQLGIYADGAHSHSISLGGGGALFQVLSPVIVLTKIIFAGTQAASRAITVEAAPGSFEELTAIREELAQLRALVMPQRRRLSAPLRGSH